MDGGSQRFPIISDPIPTRFALASFHPSQTPEAKPTLIGESLDEILHHLTQRLIVGRLFRHDDVMDVALTQTASGNSDKIRALPEIC